MNIKNGKKGNVIKDYVIIGDPIGEGSFGKVFLVQHLKSKNYYAAKMLKLEKILERPDTKRKLIRELKILMKMSHPNIARLYDIIRSQNHLYLILEYCDGENLQDVLQTNLKCFKSGFSQRLVQHLVKQLVLGLQKFRELDVIHRDLKLGNIMLCFDNFDYHSLNLNFGTLKKQIKLDKIQTDVNLNFLKEMKIYETLENINPYNVKNSENFFSYKKEHFNTTETFEEILIKSKVKIIDLGFARELEEDGTYSFCGTPCTLSPEIFQVGMKKSENLKYDSRVDIWSLGSIVFNLVTGYPPFLSNDLLLLYKNIVKGDYKISKSLRVSLDFLDFINGLLQVNPDDRFSWNEIMGHPFCNKREDKFIFVNFEKKIFENSEVNYDFKNEGNFKNVFNDVFKESNFDSNYDFIYLNANKRYEFLKCFYENIKHESFYSVKSEDESFKQNEDIIRGKINNDNQEDNLINENEDANGKIGKHSSKSIINYNNKNKIDNGNTCNVAYSGMNIHNDEVVNNYLNNEKKDLIDKIEENHEEEISDSFIENKLEFIIIEATYEMLEDEEGFIVVTYEEKEA